jgi:ABC-type amino acid transport system permease subunit
LISTTHTAPPVSIRLGLSHIGSRPRTARAHAIAWQILAGAVVAGFIAAIAFQAAANLRARGIASGFDFLDRTAGFEIARGPIDFSSRDT